MSGSQAAIEKMTTAEAAFVLGVDPSKVKKACANRLVEPTVEEAGRKLAYGDVVFLRYYLTHPDLSADQRTTLYQNVKLAPHRLKLNQWVTRVSRKARGQRKPARVLVAASQDGTLVVDLTPTIAEVSERTAELARLREAVIIGPNGEPYLRDTNAPVYRIAALVRETPDGMLDLTEARRGFPSLSQDRIETAYHYSVAYPKKGRPYPNRSLKSVLDDIEFPRIPEEDEGEE